MPSDGLPTIAVAVLLVGGRYALQHRDDHPDVAWSGHWGLFGGGVEPGESPAAAIVREIEEELGITVPPYGPPTGSVKARTSVSSMSTRCPCRSCRWHER